MRGYRSRLAMLNAQSGAKSFHEQQRIFLNDRYGATHFLKPVLDSSEAAFFTNGDDEGLQRAWARENGLSDKVQLNEILLAQIEAHRAEVFYNHDPIRFGSSFLRRLPSSVRHRIAWRAAPTGKADFSGYDLMVCNFPSILEGYRRAGMRAAYFAPAHDPVMDEYAGATERPIDILFVGGYSRHHLNRAPVLEAVAGLRTRYRVIFNLDTTSLMLSLAESPLGSVGPLRKLRRPDAIRAVGAPPLFGRSLYAALSQAKIVLNGAVDMAGEDRGNMRCWEATGCGALLLSDNGVYPEGFSNGETLVTYSSPADAVAKAERCLADQEETALIAAAGRAMIRRRYSKEQQWIDFQRLV